MITCMMCEQPTEATARLGDWDVCDAHAAAITAAEPGENADIVCNGGGQPPVLRRGKPHCPVCGQKFYWHELINQVQHVPEHF